MLWYDDLKCPIEKKDKDDIHIRLFSRYRVSKKISILYLQYRVFKIIEVNLPACKV